MGKNKAAIKESENDEYNPVTKVNGQLPKSSHNTRPPTSFITALVSVILVAALSFAIGLILLEVNTSNKDLNESLQNYYRSMNEKKIIDDLKASIPKEKDIKDIPVKPPIPSASKKEEVEKKEIKKPKESKVPVMDPVTEPVEKKLKTDKVVDPKISDKEKDKESEKRQQEMEKQIVSDKPRKSDKPIDNAEKSDTLKEKGPDKEPSKKVEEHQDKKEAEKPDVSDSKKEKVIDTSLQDLYIEVESIAEEILKEDPENSMVKQLAPHLEGVLRDLEGGKLSGLRDSLLHIKLILTDLKERLEASRSQKISPKPEEVTHKPKPEEEKSKPDSSKKADDRVPVDEVIPDPIYISPLGDKDKDGEGQGSSQDKGIHGQGHQDQGSSQKRTKESTEKVPVVEVIPEPVYIKPLGEAKKESSGSKPATEDKPRPSQKIEDKPVESQKIEDKPVQSQKIEDKPVQSQKIEDKPVQSQKIEDKPVQSQRTEDKPVQSQKVEDKSSQSQSSNDKPNAKPGVESGREANKIDKEPKIKIPDKPEKKDQPSEIKKKETPTVKVGKDSQKPKIEKEIKPEIKTEPVTSNKAEEDVQKSNLKETEAKKTTPETINSSKDKSPEKSQKELKQDETKKLSQSLPAEEKIRESDSKPKKSEEKKIAQGEKVTPDSSSSNIPSKSSEREAQIEDKLNLASALEKENVLQALNVYNSLVQEVPKSYRALFGRAKVLDKLSETEQSNARLEQAVDAYFRILELADEGVPKDMLKEAGLRCADRMNFRGGKSMLSKRRKVLRLMVKTFHDDVEVLNKVGIFYLLMNNNDEAGPVFKKVLEISPDNGFALAHIGFILKIASTNDTALLNALEYLEKGINTHEEGVDDNRLYYHLGDGYQRLGQNEKAYAVYDEAVKRGLLKNRYQRSTYNIDRLTAKPFWTPEETTYEKFFKKLQSHWQEISKEGVLALKLNHDNDPNTGYRHEGENLQEAGDWGIFELFSRGKKNAVNCKFASITCSLVEEFGPAANCRRGQIKFSVMSPGTHIYPHTGPTNCRLRAHLGLVTPKGARMRVVNETREWEAGELFIFDDSFEHEVWHEGKTIRLVLIVDVWHPELTEEEKRILKSI